jgi:hypothetical protein
LFDIILVVLVRFCACLMLQLTELLPISLAMSAKGLTGVYNFTNPGAISHNQILALYKEVLFLICIMTSVLSLHVDVIGLFTSFVCMHFLIKIFVNDVLLFSILIPLLRGRTLPKMSKPRFSRPAAPTIPWYAPRDTVCREIFSTYGLYCSPFHFLLLL